MRRPAVFGILNITRDSFSDGGKYLNPESAVARARELLQSGADFLDIGAAASNPQADHVPPAEEIRRIEPLLAAGLPVERMSVDTFAPETQLWALARNVGWINDIQGFPEPSIYGALARSSARLIVMHSVATKGIAQVVDTDPANILDRLEAFFDDRVSAMTNAGVDRQRIVVDPGMGYFLGRDPEVSLKVLRSVARLKQRYGLPVLISVSRKSFIRNIAQVDVKSSGAATLSAELFAASQGVDFLRTHDVAALKQALDVWTCLAPNVGNN